ncbi:hypothetical protein EG329_014422 [Mollisiaceae sp. DMI_Dod_QoI]|nr:hypothetical protein EG329_014422 [Helotiales sp. DMI_Dod_QoI]
MKYAALFYFEYLWESTQATNVRQASNVARPSRSEDAAFRLGQRKFNAGRAARATVQPESANTLSQEPPPFQLDTRERLRQWELENVSSINPIIDLFDQPNTTGTINGATRVQSGEFLLERDYENNMEDKDNTPHFENDLVDVGQKRNFLLPGDMVELVSAANQRQELGIFVQEFTRQSQFYTMSGRWVHKGEERVKFFVPNFVEPEALEEIKPYLPTEDVTEEIRDKLQSFDIAQVPRNLGKPLIQKMMAFWNEADKVYQTAAVKLDNAHQLVAHPRKFTYATLPQIAERVLSDTLPKMEDGNFSPAVLYALHRTMMQADIGFRPHPKQVMRGESEYEIVPLKEVQSLQGITEMVHNTRNARIAKRRGKFGKEESISFHKFIQKARQLIDASRKFRPFTDCGALGPSTKQLPKGTNIKVGEEITLLTHELPWVYFLESWACLRSFQRHSSLNGIGSSILRAIGRYDNVSLDSTTAFTCLMEMGVIPPWQTQASFDLRLPHASPRLKTSANPYPRGFKDKLRHLRKDWKDLDVYCIDDESASEIDDGLSVEPTEHPEEFWVHVHVADPAAYLKPDHPAAQYAEKLSSAIYFPDRVVPMLNPEWTRDQLSLGSGKLCLTTSIKLNLAGDILDVKIIPGVVRNVTYLTKYILHEAIFQCRPPEPTYRVVGKDSFQSTPTRRILQHHELSAKQLSDLKLFHKLSQARDHHQALKGSIKFANSQGTASVSFGNAPQTRQVGMAARYHGDPSIRISIPPVNEQGIDMSLQGGAVVVANMMLLASEATARWCHARGLPVIYRITPFNPAKDDPLKFYHEHVWPSMDKDGYPKLELAMQYLNLVGKTQPSSTPGPHLGIGADMTMQCTSPLRRFNDLVNQWQIEAALLEEARTGTSLVGNKKDDFLPYSKARIDAMLPRLAERERFIKEGQKKAEREWALKYLVRAWKFGEDELESPLLFYARSINVSAREVGGFLPSCVVGAAMVVPDGIKMEEIGIGDAFEVQIESIDVYSRRFYVRFVRKMPTSQADSPAPEVETIPETAALG